MADPSRVRVSGPLEPFADGFRAVLEGAGYRPAAAANQLRLLAHLSGWLAAEGVEPAQLTGVPLDRFRSERAAGSPALSGLAARMEPLLGYLRGLGVVPPADVAPLTAGERLLERYRSYLLVERALTVGTARGYVDALRSFVSGRAGADGEVELWALTPGGVLEFVLAETRRVSRRQAKGLVCALRSFLRFAHVKGLTARPLSGSVPTVAGWRDAGLPRALAATQVEGLLGSCDRDSAAGVRDLAVLTLLWRLGLRAGEAAALRLDDIDWRLGQLVVRGKGDRRERLPVPVDVGEALARYLQHGRPAGYSGREVFVRVKAPWGPLTSGGVTQIVVSASKRAGVGEITAHRLRHTAACEMLEHGASLREIGQVLRHRSVLNTCIYAKVDHARLRELARPWPTEAGVA